MMPTTRYRIFAVCSASMMLALQAHAQGAADHDSLALKALNRNFRLLPIELSIDLSQGTIDDSVPGLKGLAVGYDHVIWGRYQRGDSVKFSLAVRRDSAGGPFGGYVTRRARVESVEVSFSTNNGAKAADFLARFRDVTSKLGAPQFCERDTLTSEAYRAVVIKVAAMWRKDDVTVTLDMIMNAMQPHGKHTEFAPRFYVGYDARRSSDTLRSARLPTRHDFPCFLTDDEIRDRAVPLDSATNEAWRARLRPSPP